MQESNEETRLSDNSALGYEPEDTKDSEDQRDLNMQLAKNRAKKLDRNRNVYYGNLHCIWKQKTGYMIYIGPDYHMTAIVYVASALATLMLGLSYFSTSSWLYIVFTLSMYLFQTACLTLLFFSDPGIAALRHDQLEMIQDSQIESHQYCKRCDLVRWAGVEHCYDCDVCIYGYDHHCPWSSKCIGVKNMTIFHCFLGSMLAYFIYCMCSLFSHIQPT